MAPPPTVFEGCVLRSALLKEKKQQIGKQATENIIQKNTTNDEQRRLQVHVRCLLQQHQATNTSVVVVVVVGGGGVVIVAVFVISFSLKFVYFYVFL